MRWMFSVFGWGGIDFQSYLTLLYSKNCLSFCVYCLSLFVCCSHSLCVVSLCLWPRTKIKWPTKADNSLKTMFRQFSPLTMVFKELSCFFVISSLILVVHIWLSRCVSRTSWCLMNCECSLTLEGAEICVFWMCRYLWNVSRVSWDDAWFRIRCEKSLISRYFMNCAFFSFLIIWRLVNFLCLTKCGWSILILIECELHLWGCAWIQWRNLILCRMQGTRTCWNSFWSWSCGSAKTLILLFLISVCTMIQACLICLLQLLMHKKIWPHRLQRCSWCYPWSSHLHKWAETWAWRVCVPQLPILKKMLRLWPIRGTFPALHMRPQSLSQCIGDEAWPSFFGRSCQYTRGRGAHEYFGTAA